jgi:hypothetical protein
MKTKAFRILAVPVLLSITAIGGCGATNHIVSQWSNSAYSSLSFKRIMVIGVNGETSIQRNFEDEFVAQLKAAGFDAVPSYRYFPEGEQFSREKLKQMAQAAGADAAIVTHRAHVEHRTEVAPGYYSLFPGFGVYGWSSFGWHGLYEPPRFYGHEVYTAETTLYDVSKNEIVWTGTVRTEEPHDVDKAIKGYVESVTKALRERKVLKKE